MKKSLIYILAITTALFSCSKSSLEQEGGLLSDIPVIFSPTADWPTIVQSNAANNPTKGLINNATDLRQYGISLLSTASIGENTNTVFNNTKLQYTNSAWNYGTVQYWIPGAEYKFAAFAPYAGNTGESGNISNGEVSITGSTTAPAITIENYITGKVSSGSEQFDARNEDLLFADYVRDNTSSNDYSAVPLQFNHLLSCITFNIRNTTNNDIIGIDNIRLTGLKYKGTINITLNSATLTPSNEPVGSSETYFEGADRPATGETSPFLPKGMSENDFKPLFECEYLTVFPQSLYGTNANLEFTVIYSGSSSKNFTLNLGNVESISSWAIGKKYKYNILITS